MGPARTEDAAMQTTARRLKKKTIVNERKGKMGEKKSEIKGKGRLINNEEGQKVATWPS